MGEVTSLNYKALALSGTAQLGSDTKSNGTNLTDGLSVSELESMDTNGDGIITEAEFKAAYTGSDADTYWNTYINFYNASSKTSSDGTTTVTQVDADGTTVESTYDKDGNLTSYQKIVTNADGSTDTSVYDANGTLTQVTTAYRDGSSKSVNYETGTTTNEGADGTTVTLNSSGNITSVKTGDSSTSISINYGSNGSDIESIKVGNTTYTNITVKNGKITVKNDSGKTVLAISELSNGSTSIVKYSNGKRTEAIRLNSDDEPNSIFTYDSNGYSTKRVYCNTGVTRTYERDSDGNIITSTDYNSSGVKTSVQTYATTNGSEYYENNTDALWSSRTYYDADGNVTKYLTYSYEKNSDGTVTKTTKTYSDTSKSTLKSTTTATQDSYGNTLSSVTKKASASTTSTTEYTYDTTLDAKLSNKHLDNTVTTSGNTKTTKYYLNGIVIRETTENISTGETTSVEYNYYSSGSLKKKTETASDGSSVSTSYSESGNITQVDKYNSAGNITKSEKYDDDGNITQRKVYDDGVLKNSQEINSDGSREITNYDEDGNITMIENVSSDGTVESGQYTVTELLKRLYPNMSTSQLNEIAAQIMSDNNLSSSDLISYDWKTGSFGDITWPNIIVDENGIYSIGEGTPAEVASAPVLDEDGNVIDSSSTTTTSTTTTTTLKNKGTKWAYSETTDSSGNKISGIYTTQALMKALYGDQNDGDGSYEGMYTLDQEKVGWQLAEANNISIMDMVVEYNWLTGECSIELPEIEIQDDNKYVIKND